MKESMYRIFFLVSFIILLSFQPINASSDIYCKDGSILKSNQTLVGFAYSNRRLYSSTKDPVIGALVLIENKTFNTIETNMLVDSMKFIFPLSPNEKPVTLKKVALYVERLGQDHCVFYGVPAEIKLKEWTILSTNKINSLRRPSPKETSRFYQINTKCVQQGDYDEGKGPPCVKPKLLAVSDINQNNKLEYWYTDPYLWNTGLTIGEETQNNELNVIEFACPSCD